MDKLKIFQNILQSALMLDESVLNVITENTNKIRAALAYGNNYRPMTFGEIVDWSVNVRQAAIDLVTNSALLPVEEKDGGNTLDIRLYESFVLGNEIHSLLICSNKQTGEKFFCTSPSLEHLKELGNAEIFEAAQRNPIFSQSQCSDLTLQDPMQKILASVLQSWSDSIRALCVLETIATIKKTFNPQDMYLFLGALMVDMSEHAGGTVESSLKAKN